MTTQETQQEIMGELGGHRDWMDKYEYLIKLGKTLPAMSPERETNDTLIKGCQVKTWFHSKFENGEMVYETDSLSYIVKGAAVLLLKILNHRQPREVIEADLYFIKQAGLSEIFSPSRANSLWKMLNQMRADAELAERQKNNQEIF